MTDTGRRLQIVDAAAGRAHVVGLATDGSLWSAGDGLNGQLGIGTRQFGLCTGDGDTDIVANGTGEEFAVHWQRIGYRGSIGR
jgi:alpha-tubulin suppressor-like RCC1 family protein